MTEVTSAPPSVELDPQDPLPESNWEYRRWFVFVLEIAQAVALAALIFLLFRIALMAARASSIPALLQVAGYFYKLCFWMIMLSMVNRVLYLIAPSAEQATKMMQTVRAALGGVSFRKTQTAVSTPAGSSGTTTSTVEATPNVQPASPVATDAGRATDQPSPSPVGSGADSIPDLPPSQRGN